MDHTASDDCDGARPSSRSRGGFEREGNSACHHVAAHAARRPRPSATAGPRSRRAALLGLLVCAAGPLVRHDRGRGQTIVTDTGAPTSSFMSAEHARLATVLGWLRRRRSRPGLSGTILFGRRIVPITTDMLDGTWFVDARAHLTTDNGQFFSNLGIGRRQYVELLEFDRRRQRLVRLRWRRVPELRLPVQPVGRDRRKLFNPVGDFRFNGYFPVGTTSHVLNQFDAELSAVRQRHRYGHARRRCQVQRAASDPWPR